ncbi:hypothetical protein CAL7716_101720 (plasmid) [Calothrix sp. PCC 7716]|nr:hypothetical protein CAL7716_101720 [Calothrix sp. PCC 7716]
MIIFSQVNVVPGNTGASGIGIIYVIAGLAYLILWNKFNQRTASTLDIAQLVIGASALLLNGFILIFQGWRLGVDFEFTQFLMLLFVGCLVTKDILEQP